MANFTSYADIFDPEVIKRLVGEGWLNDPNVVRAGIIMRDARPMQGSLLSEVRQKTFQDSSGQSLKAGDEISALNKTQEKANMPNLWRYNAINMPDVIEDIEIKDVPAENASMAAAIQAAAAQYVDDSVIKTIEGAADALTANQFDAGANDISLAFIADTKAKSLDKIRQLDSGAIIMDSKVYYDALALGLVTNDNSTFGLATKEQMVKDGNLPTNVLGLTPIVTDKLALDAGDHRVFLVGANTVALRGSGAPDVEVHRIEKSFSSFTKFRVPYGVGVPGLKWNLGGKEDVSDTELATAANWTLATNAHSNDVAIYRLQVQA